MGDNDLFAPPTKEELKKQADLFAPPSKSELASLQKSVKSESQSPLYTAGEHAANMAAGGYLPQLVAGAAKAAAPIYDIFTGSHVTQDLPSYTELRDQQANQLKSGKEQNPVAGTAGDVGGALLGGAGAGVAARSLGILQAAPSGAGALSRMAANFKAGAALSGAYNPGETPGEISPLQAEDRLINAGIGGATSAILPEAWDAVKKGGSKLLGMVTNTPTKAIEIYGERAPEVSKVINDTGGELSVAADEMKSKVLNNIKSLKQEQSEEIKSTLSGPLNDKMVSTKPILEKLSEIKDNLNPHYHPGDISQIQEMSQAIKSTAPEGQMNLSDLFDTTNFLRTRSQGSFLKNGELFTTGEQASKAANAARKVATDMLHTEAPSIQHADSIYAELHSLNDKMDASLLGLGKPENVFASAGGGSGNVNQVNLRKIGELTGTNPLSDAELIYAAKYFKDPSIRQAALRLGLNVAHPASKLVNPATAGLLVDQGLQPVIQNSTAIERRLKSR